MAVGALDGDRPEGGLEGLGMASGAACLPSGGAGTGRYAGIGAVGVEAPLDGAGSELQGLATQVGPDCLAVNCFGRPGAYEAGNLGFECRGELLLVRFLCRAGAWPKAGLARVATDSDQAATRRRRR